jgi:hypothetical protein
MQNLNDNFPDLKIELMTDEQGSLIILEQDSCGNVDRVAIHPIHIRHMAEKMGLIEANDPTARKTIATLTRRLLALNDRIIHLDYWLTNHSDSKHADLSYEQTYAMATADIAAEFCAELVGTEPPAMTPAPAPTVKASLASAPCGHGATTVQTPLI